MKNKVIYQIFRKKRLISFVLSILLLIPSVFLLPISNQTSAADVIERTIHDNIDFNVSAIPDSAGEGFEPHIIAGPGIDGTQWYYIDSPTGLGGGQSGNLWISKDYGDTWEPHPYGRNALGSGDSYTAIAKDGTIYYTDLYLWSSTIDTSKDGGNTWLRNPLATVTRVGDRQWLDMGPTVRRIPGAQAETLYMIYNDLPQGLIIQRSSWTSQGLVWVMGNNRLPVSTTTGSRDHFAVDKRDGTIYLPNKEGDEVAMYVSTNGADSFTRYLVLTTTEDAQNIFIAADVDNEGNVYITWSTQAHVFLGTSTDQGASWKITQVTDTNGTRVLPWVVAGDPGRVALTWYDTPDTDNSSDEKGDDVNWSTMTAISINALSDNPHFIISPIFENIHTGAIRTTGTGGDADRDLGDFFTCDMDEFGRVIVTFGMDGDDGPNARQSEVMFAKQLEGPFLLEKTGPMAIFENRTLDLTVKVDASRSYDRNGGGIIDYWWDWGDGTNSTGIIAEHTYKTSGTYKITLKVINTIDMRDTASELVSVMKEGIAEFNYLLIVLPIILIAICATVYYWYKKRPPQAIEVEAI